jgi:hypothetical protein
LASGDFSAPTIYQNSFFGAKKSPDAIFLGLELNKKNIKKTLRHLWIHGVIHVLRLQVVCKYRHGDRFLTGLSWAS